MTMKIGIVGTRGVPARYGGFETCAEELAKRLAARGHRVYVACRRYLYPEAWGEKQKQDCRAKTGLPRSQTTFPRNDNVNIFFPPSLPGKATDTFSHTFFGVFFILFFQPVDVFLVFNIANSPLVLLLRILGKRAALNTDGLEWKRRKWGPLARAYFRFCELVACLSGAALISDSRAIADYYRRKYGKRTVFIPYGAEVGRGCNPSPTLMRGSRAENGIAAPPNATGGTPVLPNGARNDILREYGLEKSGYLLVVGRLESENNADLIIRAFQKVKTDKLLIVVGGTNWKSFYSRRLKKTEDPRVRFLGAVYRPGHLNKLLEGCYFYVHGHEVGGTNPALLQAMGCGCCVLALETIFNLEAAGEAGLFFAKDEQALAQKMQYLLANPEVVRYYLGAAPERIKKFYSWNRVVEEYEKILTRDCHAGLRSQ